MKRITKRRSLLIAPLAVIAAATVVPAGSSAAPPTPVSGTFTTTDATFDSIRDAAGNSIIRVTAHVAYTGTFDGTSVLHGILTAHPNGRAEFQDKETFTGTVNGVPGTVEFSLSGSNDPDLNIKAVDTITGASGELAGLRGQLRETGSVVIPTGPSGTYTGHIQ
jgi:hypothetical protein